MGRSCREQCAAAMAVYGPRTTLVVALPSSSLDKTERVAFELTLNHDASTWTLTKHDLVVSASGQIFAPGNLRATADHGRYRTVVDYWIVSLSLCYE